MVSRWLKPGNRTFLEVANMVVTWWIVAFLPSEILMGSTIEVVNPIILLCLFDFVIF